MNESEGINQAIIQTQQPYGLDYAEITTQYGEAMSDQIAAIESAIYDRFEFWGSDRENCEEAVNFATQQFPDLSHKAATIIVRYISYCAHK